MIQVAHHHHYHHHHHHSHGGNNSCSQEIGLANSGVYALYDLFLFAVAGSTFSFRSIYRRHGHTNVVLLRLTPMKELPQFCFCSRYLTAFHQMLISRGMTSGTLEPYRKESTYSAQRLFKQT